MLRLLTLGLLLLAQAQGEPGGGGLIRGVLTDATGAVLPGGFIRVFQTPSNALITRLRVEPDGGFQTGQLQPGSYIVVAWVQGFSARRSSVVILEGQTTDMGKIQLEVGSCDAPGVMCDDFGIGPPDRIRSQGYLELKMDCGVNLRESKVYCPDASGGPKGQAFDVRATREGVAVYLIAVNGSSYRTSGRVSPESASMAWAQAMTFGLGPARGCRLTSSSWMMSNRFRRVFVSGTSPGENCRNQIVNGVPSQNRYYVAAVAS